MTGFLKIVWGNKIRYVAKNEITGIECLDETATKWRLTLRNGSWTNIDAPMGELDRDFAPSSAIFSYSVGGRYSQSPYIKFTYYDAKHCRSDRDELRITTLNSEDKFVIFKGETPAEINERILETVPDGERERTPFPAFNRTLILKS